MKIRYRVLESVDEHNNHFVVGIAHTGFSTPVNGMAAFMSDKSLKEDFLNIPLEKVSIDVIPGLLTDTHQFSFSEISEKDISDEDDEWTPDELLEEAEAGLSLSNRKTA